MVAIKKEIPAPQNVWKLAEIRLEKILKWVLREGKKRGNRKSGSQVNKSKHCVPKFRKFLRVTACVS